MFKREIKINLKSFVIWLLSLTILFLIVYLVYPSIANNEEINMLNEMIKIFPDELLQAFNMDISSIDSAYGWLKTEGFLFILLITGCYSGIIGSNIILKEESDKTIEYLHSLPITRNKIIFNKVLVGLIYIISLVVGIGLFNYFGLVISGEFNTKQYILLSITPLFSSLPIYFICLFLATFTNKTKKMLSLSLGIVIMSYILNTISSISEKTEFLKYFSVFTLVDLRNVILNVSIKPIMIFISLAISIFFFILTITKYNKKELV